MSALNIVILAAGKGTRMYSEKPKVLHELAGRPLLRHVLDCAAALGPQQVCVVYGHGGEAVPQAIQQYAANGQGNSASPENEVRHARYHPNPLGETTSHSTKLQTTAAKSLVIPAGEGVMESLHETQYTFVIQEPQLGTGHAVQQAMPHLDDASVTLVLYGDVPLIQHGTLHRMQQAGEGLVLLTVNLDNPAGYGRIVRDEQGDVLCIVEEKDATPEQREIGEVNTGILLAPTGKLRGWLADLKDDNAQGEYYLTDIVAMAVRQGIAVHTVQPAHEWEIHGVNSKAQLAALERAWQRVEAERLLAHGVTLADPARVEVRGKLDCGRDVEIDVGCIFEGEVRLGNNVQVGAYSIVRNTAIADGARIAPYSLLDGSEVGVGCFIGPYARLRPGTKLHEGVHIGNFVEVKNSEIAAHSKANHLSYLGDSTVGSRVNIGAGTITCNYDGAYKHRTVIEDDVFIGSDTQLVAPVTVGKGSTIGAGSTITRNAPAGELTLSRSKQTTINGWKRPAKQVKSEK